MALSTAAYLEKYFDCMDAMPLELQRSVSELRELELQHRRLLGDVEELRQALDKAVAGGKEEEVGRVVRRLQHCMLAVRDLGNLKMEVSSQLVDTVEEYSQQLSLSAKVLDSPRSHDDHHHHSPRHTSSSSHSHTHNGKADSQLMQSEMMGEKTATKRTSSAKKPRTTQLEKPREREESPPITTGRSRENSTTSSGGGGGGAGGGGGGAGGGGGGSGGANSGPSNSGTGKPPRKKIKAKKKGAAAGGGGGGKESSVNLPDPSNLPMPDLSSQPLDPNEPLYCSCQQVSFGEMIGCDNEDCPIEWFHFQCVGLTSKPKGKWYCPQCATDRKTKGVK